MERAYLRGKASLISGKTEEQLFAWVAAQQTGNAEEAIERLKQMKKEGKVFSALEEAMKLRDRYGEGEIAELTLTEKVLTI